MAFHVKSKSAAVMGEPSAQTARGSRWKVTVNGSVASPPFSRDGASVSRGDGTQLDWSSRVIAFGMTGFSTAQDTQEICEQEVMGLRHCGHCSAPKTTEPPRLGPLAGGAGASCPPPPQPPARTASSRRPYQGRRPFTHTPRRGMARGRGTPAILPDRPWRCHADGRAGAAAPMPPVAGLQYACPSIAVTGRAARRRAPKRRRSRVRRRGSMRARLAA